MQPPIYAKRLTRSGPDVNDDAAGPEPIIGSTSFVACARAELTHLITEFARTLPWRGESTANSSLKLGADSGRVMDDSGIVKRCFGLEFRRKLSSLPWQPAPHSDN